LRGGIHAATVAKEPFTGESTKQAVKPLRREGRDAPAEPVCSCARFYAQIAHETAGAARTRSSLRPLTLGLRSIANLGRNAPREREHTFSCHPRQLSSPRRRGSSIPEAAVIEPRSRSVLDPRLRGDDDSGFSPGHSTTTKPNPAPRSNPPPQATACRDARP
jgi:hypothetical protein